MIKTISKRDGRVTDFNIDKISNAIFLASESIGEGDMDLAKSLAIKVQEALEEEEKAKEEKK